MNRAGLLFLLFAPMLAAAAPVPKQTEKEQIESKFGKIVDPKGDSKFALDGDELKVTLPAGEERRFGYTKDADFPEGKKPFDHTPRVEFTRTGDFTLIVRVKSPVEVEALPPHRGWDGGYSGGGVVITSKGGKEYRYGSLRVGGKNPATTFVIEWPGTLSQGIGCARHEKLTEETNWIRVTRVGKALAGHASTDGLDWINLLPFDDAIADETAALSLYAQHGSDKAHTVTFDKFSIEKPKAEKK